MKKFLFISSLLATTFGAVGQNVFTNQNVTPGPSAVDGLIQRMNDIGKVSGSVNDYFTKNEQRMLQVHFNGIESMAPVTVTQTSSQNLDAGAGIACANAVRFTDNSLYRVFDLVGDHGLTDGLKVESVQFGFDEDVSTPAGFPVTINVYSINNASDFPAVYNSMTLEGTAVYMASNSDSMTVVTQDVDAVIPAGKAMVVELRVEDDGTDSNYMRFGCNLSSQTKPAYIMAAECGANTPTSFSALGLTNALVLNVIGDSDAGGNPNVGVVYGIDNATEQLVSFMVDDTTLNPIATSPATDFENAGSIDPADQGTAYVLLSEGRFYKVDLASGAYTTIGTVSPPGAQTWTGAEFDPTTGILYAIASDLVSTGSLYKIDKVAGTKELVGNNDVDGAISLMIDGNGVGYSHNISDNSFYKIDIQTGAATYIGGLGFDVNYGQGGTWVPGDDGFVYLSAFNNDSFQAEWRRVDVSTGSSTLIAPIVWNNDLAQIGWSSAMGATIGINELTMEEFTFFPNPIVDYVNLKAKNNIESVQLYNIAGQLVYSAEIGKKDAKIDLTSLAPGIHLMKITVNGQVGTYKVLRK